MHAPAAGLENRRGARSARVFDASEPPRGNFSNQKRHMSYTEWLRRQVSKLEDEIHAHSVFDSDDPATPQQLHELRTMVVLHTYLRQQLLRRETVTATADATYDTQELVLVRKTTSRQVSV